MGRGSIRNPGTGGLDLGTRNSQLDNPAGPILNSRFPSSFRLPLVAPVRAAYLCTLLADAFRAPRTSRRMDPIYLDHAATTPLRPEVRDAMLPYLGERFGNPSSVHRWGREARAALDDARARLAALIGARPSEVLFTRGGTEADNLAVFGRVRCGRGAPMVCSAFEHKAVLGAAHAARGTSSLHIAPVTAAGVVDEAALGALLDPRPCLVSIMWVNNEIGTIQPIERIAERCAEAGVPFHSDAIQAFGKLPVRVDRVPVSMLSLSAHKFCGPKGVGAIYVRRGTVVMPLIHGGGQERGLRSGTEDVAGAVGMAVAAELAEREREESMQRLAALRDHLEGSLRARLPDLVINGVAAPRVPTITNVSVPGTEAEVLLPALDLEGIAVSSGSACSSGSSGESGVLTALGVPPDLARASIRISLGHQTTRAEIDRTIDGFVRVVSRIRSLAAAG
jgi:cysteine desulfurase